MFLWKKKSDIKQACYDDVKKDVTKIFKEAKMFLEDKNEKSTNFFN